MQKAIHCYISGLVQGVFFRASTRDYALELGLTGWVKNLSDGRVEVYACGDEGTIDKLHRWLHNGPADAEVTAVEAVDAEIENHIGFEIKYD